VVACSSKTFHPGLHSFRALILSVSAAIHQRLITHALQEARTASGEPLRSSDPSDVDSSFLEIADKSRSLCATYAQLPDLAVYRAGQPTQLSVRVRVLLFRFHGRSRERFHVWINRRERS